jgi:lysophospholipase L1-like esterase
MKLRLFLTLLLSLVSTACLAATEDFAFRNGDTVVFLGDSITAAHGYTKLVEEYTLLRFPDRHVQFINAGRGGDTAAGGLQRLERDVIKRGATVVTVAYGVNDILWGAKADDEHKRKYLDGIRGIVETCQHHHVRVYICSPAITAENPDTAEMGFLQKMTDEGLALAKSLGAGTVDLQRSMRAIQRQVIAANKAETDPKKQTHLHAEDTIHLTDLGQLAMGYAMLKGLGAPQDVSSVAIDAKDCTLLSAKDCRVDELHSSSNKVTFTRIDEGLPLNLGMLGGLNFRFIPIPDELNRYLLTIRSLPKGSYHISVDGHTIGTATAGQLSSSLNISSMTTNAWEPGGPWDAQAAVVKELTEARSKMEIANNLRTYFLTNHPQTALLINQARIAETNLMNLQRQAAHPFPYHFEIRKLE